MKSVIFIFLFFLISSYFLATKIIYAAVQNKNVDLEIMPIVKDHNQCVRAINYYEKKYKLPKHILHAISTVESGLWSTQHGMNIPWPWTLNIEGKPYFFHTQREAANFLKQNIAIGKKNIDIGCAQINWYYHGHNFSKPEDLLYPVYNIAYAAHFLMQNFYETNSWYTAVARYHSRTQDLGSIYLKKVTNVLKQIPFNWSLTQDNDIMTQYGVYKNNSFHYKALSNNADLFVFSRNNKVIQNNHEGSNTISDNKVKRELSPNTKMP